MAGVIDLTGEPSNKRMRTQDNVNNINNNDDDDNNNNNNNEDTVPMRAEILTYLLGNNPKAIVSALQNT